MSINSLCSSGTPTANSRPKSAPKVLYVATSKNQGGLERYSVRLAQLMQERGVSITYACLPGEIIDALCREVGIPTLPLQTRNSGDLRSARTLTAQILEHDFDIVHVHSRRDYVPALLGVAEARRQRKSAGRSPALILHTHMVRALGEPAWLNRLFFQWAADAVLAVSGAVHDAIQQAHGFPPGFVRVLHNGVDTSEFALPGTERADGWRQLRREEWGIPADALVIGMVGRLDAKGQASLLAVAPVLMERFPSLYLVLVGPDGLPGEGERLAKAADEAGIGGRIILPGSRTDIPSIQTAFDILAHLPLDDALPLALMEAMASGLPTIATDIPGCAEIMRPEVTGLKVPASDLPALERAAHRLLEMSVQERRQMGAMGRAEVEARFSLPRQISRLHEIYEELCPLPRLSRS